MKSYPCRLMHTEKEHGLDAVKRDRRAFQEMCERSQNLNWAGLKPHLVFSLQIWERLEKLVKVMAEADIIVEDVGVVVDVVVGFLLMLPRTRDKPPTLRVVAMGMDGSLLQEERWCVGLSMLLYGYPLCKELGLVKGWGSVVGENDDVLGTFGLVEQFRARIAGRAPGKEPWLERKPHTRDVEVKIDATYEQALRAAIGSLRYQGGTAR